MTVKVLISIDGLGTGGAERSLSESLPHFPVLGVHPTVVCLYRREEGVQDQLIGGGHDIRYLEASTFRRRVLEMRRLLGRERPQLLHTTLFESTMVGRLASVATGVPVLTSLVSTNYDPVRLADPRIRRTKLTVVKLLDATSGRWLTDHFHAVSEAVKQAAMQALRIPDQKISVVERGRDPDRLGAPSPERRARVRARHGWADDDRIIVTVGRQEYAKGHQHLIAAMATVLGRHPNAILLLVGRRGNASGEVEEALRAADARDRIQLLGHREDIGDLLAASDLFVLPSLYEGLPGTIVEAMALGLPVVASDIPAVREVCEADVSALLVPRGRADRLAEAIDTLLADPETAHAMGERGRRLFRARFTIERSARRMADLYHRVALVEP